MPLIASEYATYVKIALAITDDAKDLSKVEYDLDKDEQCPANVKELAWPREFWSRDGQPQRVERTYVLPWSAAPLFCQWALGYASNEPSEGAPGVPGTGAISRVIPAQDPRYPWLYCSACELLEGRGAIIDDPTNFALDGDGKVQERDGSPAVVMCGAAVENLNAGGPAYYPPPDKGNDHPGPESGRFNDGRAVYRCTFTAPRGYRVFNDRAAGLHKAGEMCRMLRIDYQPSFEGLPAANVYGQLITFADGTVAKEAGVYIVPGGVATYEWLEVPDPPFDAIDQLKGTVNLAPLYAGPGRKPFAPGQALFFQPRLDPWVNCVGRVVWNVTYRFGIRPVAGGWNGFPRADPKGFRFELAGVGAAPPPGGAGPPVYAFADHSLLFQVGPPVNWRTD